MKKTCFVLALLGVLNLAYGQGSADEQALADLQDTVSLTFSNAANTAESQMYSTSNLRFFAFTLGNNLDTGRVTTTATQGGNQLTTIPTFSAVELQSITFKTGAHWNNLKTKVYIAEQTTKTIVAISSNTISGSNIEHQLVKFEFKENTLLSSDTTYLLMFINDDVDLPKAGESAIAKADGTLYTNGRGVATIGNNLKSETSSELGFCDKKGAILSTAYSPIMTIQATAKNVPEPSVAVLGLLALGGLAARRRRK